VTIKQLYIAGAGLMGAGIAQTAITSGYEVTLREVDDGLVGRGVENITKRLASLVQKGKLDAGTRDAALARLHPTTSLEAAGRADFVIEAIRALMEGLGTREDIDQGAKLGLHHPMGPLELADFVGLDTHLYICGVLYEGLHDPRFAAPPLLRQLVDAGHFGRKTGRG